MEWPVSSTWLKSLITISAMPSMICIKVSNGEVLSENVSPESKDTALTLPVVFLMIVLINTELGIYSNISTTMNAFDFSNSGVSKINVIELKNRKKIIGRKLLEWAGLFLASFQI